MSKSEDKIGNPPGVPMSELSAVERSAITARYGVKHIIPPDIFEPETRLLDLNRSLADALDDARTQLKDSDEDNDRLTAERDEAERKSEKWAERLLTMTDDRDEYRSRCAKMEEIEKCTE